MRILLGEERYPAAVVAMAQLEQAAAGQAVLTQGEIDQDVRALNAAVFDPRVDAQRALNWANAGGDAMLIRAHTALKYLAGKEHDTYFIDAIRETAP